MPRVRPRREALSTSETTGAGSLGHDDDIDANGALDAPTRGILKTQRKRLRQLLKAEHVERLRQIKLIDDILACTDRVLNPAAHSGTPPLYEKEVQDALASIKQLEVTLIP